MEVKGGYSDADIAGKQVDAKVDAQVLDEALAAAKQLAHHTVRDFPARPAASVFPWAFGDTVYLQISEQLAKKDTDLKIQALRILSKLLHRPENVVSVLTNRELRSSLPANRSQGSICRSVHRRDAQSRGPRHDRATTVICLYSLHRQ